MVMAHEVREWLVAYGVSPDGFKTWEETVSGMDVVIVECLDPPRPAQRKMSERPSSIESSYAAVVSRWMAVMQDDRWQTTKSPPWGPEEAHNGIVYGRNPPQLYPSEESPQ